MSLIANVLKRVKEGDFVRYINGKFLDKQDKEIAVSGGGGGGTGDNTQDAINAADEKVTPADGDRIAITDSEANGLLKYFSWSGLKNAIVSYLKSLDFVRVNNNKDLINGADTVVTQSATGMRYQFQTGTTVGNPGARQFRFNATLPPAIGTTVIMMINYLDKNDTDISDFVGAWQASGTVSIRSAFATDTSFAVLSIVSVSDQDPDTYFQVTAKWLGGNSFVGGESCVIQYVPPTDVANAINNATSKATPVDADKIGLVDSAAANVLKYLSWSSFKTTIDAYLKTLGYLRIDSGGRLLDGSNNVVDAINAIYAIASAPVSGFTTLPAANTVTHGTVVSLHRDCLVGTGQNPIGILLRADEFANVWRPGADRALLFSKRFGTIASPTLTMTNTTQATSKKFAIGTDLVIPAGLLYAGCRLVISARFRRNVTVVGLGSVIVKGYIGTDTTNHFNNAIFWNVSMTDANDRDILPESEIAIITATSAVTTNNGTSGGAGAATTFDDMTLLFNTASNMTIAWRVETNLDANNTIDFLGYDVWMVAA